MNKRPVMIAAATMLCGCILILYDNLIFAFLPLVLLPFIFYRRPVRRACVLLIITVICFFTGVMSSFFHEKIYDSAFLNINSKHNVTIYGTLTAKEKTANGVRNTMALRGHNNIKVTFTTEGDVSRIGSRISVTGSPTAPDELRNPGCFDEKSYYRSQSVVTTIREPVVKNLSRNRFSIFELLFILRYRILSVLTTVLPGEEGTLLASLCIGTKSLMDPEVKTMLSEAGLSHILAISGLHITIMGGCFYKFLKKLRLAVKPASIVSFIFVFFYAHAISDSVSARRAVIMYLIFTISKIFIEKTDTLCSLSIAAIYVCLTDPLAINGAAFVMSFSAMLLIAIVSQPAGRCYQMFCDLRWENTHKKIKGNRHKNTAFEDLISTILFSFCIQLSMAAISAGYFYTFPLLSCLLNTVVLPFLPFLILMGVFGGLIGIIYLPLAKVLMFPCHLILYWYELSSSSYNKIPMSNIVTGRLHPVEIMLCLTLVLVISVLLRHEYRRMFTIRFTKIPWKKIQLFPVFGSKRTTLASAAMSGIIILILAIPHHEDSFAMIDVGQGDGIIMTTSDGKCFIYDGGSTTEYNIGTNIILPSLKYRGVGHVEGWFLTHFDDDHISGFTELADRGYPIRNLYISSKIPHDEKYDMITELCHKHDITINYLDTGDRLECNFFTIDTVFPDRSSSFEGANENSLVTIITLNWKGGSHTRIIETGDIGSEQEKYILEKYYALLQKNSHDTLILKSAHHGSNNSNSYEWLHNINPDLILISAGEGNRYGHPGKDTLQRINDEGLKYLCTIDTGQIRLLPDSHFDITRSGSAL